MTRKEMGQLDKHFIDQQLEGGNIENISYQAGSKDREEEDQNEEEDVIYQAGQWYTGCPKKIKTLYFSPNFQPQ